MPPLRFTWNDKAREKAIKANPSLKVLFTTKQDEIMANKCIDGYITERMKHEILYRCYGLVVRRVMKGGSCCRLCAVGSIGKPGC